MNIKKYFFPSFFIFIIFISILGLFHSGFPITHDGDVHVLRLTNFYQSLREGNIVPRWAANVNYGYGQPVFEFFYPAPLYLASVLHIIGFSFADSLKIILGMGMVLSGVTMYLWLTKIFNKQAGYVGGLLYVFAPFRFVDTYVRGDIGESFAFVFLPLILYCIYKIEKTSTFLWVLFGGISFALLIITHNIISLMVLPFILFYGIFCFLHHNKKKLFGRYFFCMLLVGFALSAFFWMPGLIEGKYTLRNIVTAGEYKSRFVAMPSLLYGSWNYGGTGEFTVQLGIIQWIVFLISLIPIVFSLRKKDTNALFLVGTWIYVLSGIFFMVPVSNIIWSKIILLQNFQFPWRFLAITIVGTSILGGHLVQCIPKKYIVMSLLIFTVFILFLNKDYMRAKGFVNRPDTFLEGIQRAPADTGESSPIWSIRFMEHGYKNPLEIISGNAIIHQIRRNTTEHIYFVHVRQRSRFLENTLYFPGWEILVNGTPASIEFQDEQYRGLMTFYLNPGQYTIETKFISTKLRRFADDISLVSIVVTAFFLFAYIYKKYFPNEGLFK